MTQDDPTGGEAPETQPEQPATTPPPTAPPPTPQPAAAPAATAGADDPSQENPVLACLCYIVGIIIAVIILATDMKKSRYMRFHAFQSLFLAVVFIVVWIVAFILMFILAMIPGLGVIAPLIFPLIGLAVLVLCIVLAVKAYNKEELELPVITQMARDQADKMKA